jgi:hypothetical protein
MTDIPAKIPRPIGSTEIFFPGIWKAAWAVPEGEEEALSAAVTAGVPLLGVEVVVAGVEVGDGEVVGLVDVVVDEEEEETSGVLERETEVKIIAGDTEDDAEVVVEVLWVEDVELVVDVEAEEVVVEEVVDVDCKEVEVNADDEELLDEGAVPATTWHCRTTCTRGSPLDPATDVNVITHVSVTGPTLVSIVCTVCMTTGSEKGAFGACRR